MRWICFWRLLVAHSLHMLKLQWKFYSEQLQYTCVVHVVWLHCAGVHHIRCYACIARALCMRCASVVHALCMHCACVLHALCMHCACVLHALCMHCACVVHALCMRCACVVHALCTHCACIVHVLCKRCAYIVHASHITAHPAEWNFKIFFLNILKKKLTSFIQYHTSVQHQ
jgi:hypothetical protein